MLNKANKNENKKAKIRLKWYDPLAMITLSISQHVLFWFILFCKFIDIF